MGGGGGDGGSDNRAGSAETAPAMSWKDGKRSYDHLSHHPHHPVTSYQKAPRSCHTSRRYLGLSACLTGPELLVCVPSPPQPLSVFSDERSQRSFQPALCGKGCSPVTPTPDYRTVLLHAVLSRMWSLSFGSKKNSWQGGFKPTHIILHK